MKKRKSPPCKDPEGAKPPVSAEQSVGSSVSKLSGLTDDDKIATSGVQSAAGPCFSLMPAWPECLQGSNKDDKHTKA